MLQISSKAFDVSRFNFLVAPLECSTLVALMKREDRQSSMVGFGEMRQLEVLRLILEEIGYNWYFGFVNSS
ncbi:hypothetical protein Tco_1031675 [Tanacetum coccineum]|uniref:Uncharacterized protein n=1 Tax=Tanacetum coccineum TaxID=301880 RepID=A0ABQ5GAH5_9ASTR